LKCKWLNVRKDAVSLPNGVELDDFYVLEYPTWVNVIAINEDGLFVMERQYRHAAGVTCFELPCGVMEEGETPLEAAKRELLEETGYANGEWTQLMSLSPNSSSVTNMSHSFLAVGVEKVSDQHLDATEDLSVHLLTKEEVWDLLDNNKIIQALMVAPLMKYFLKNPIQK